MPRRYVCNVEPGGQDPRFVPGWRPDHWAGVVPVANADPPEADGLPLPGLSFNAPGGGGEAPLPAPMIDRWLAELLTEAAGVGPVPGPVGPPPEADGVPLPGLLTFPDPCRSAPSPDTKYRS